MNHSTPDAHSSSLESNTLSELYPLDPQRAWPRGISQLEDSLSLLTQALSEVFSAERESPVRASCEPDILSEQLNLTLTREPQTLPQVVKHLTQVLNASPLTSGPRFFNQLFAGRDPAALCGELLAALGNHSVYTYKVAGPIVLIEDELTRRLGTFAGFVSPSQPCGGIFTPGGSLSNLAAMLCARDRCDPEWRETGGITGRIYASSESHYSVKKGAGIAGIGRRNVVSVPCDADGRMDPRELQRHITADRDAGLTPMLVVATAGTTVRGAFDPFAALADICEREDVWLHVDGAFGGSALLTPTLDELTQGIERADSLTWDAHKAMGVPLTCSVLLTRDPKACQRTLSESASYLFQADSDRLNPGTRSLQCGRRNDALKLWAAWRYHGDEGLRLRIERARALTLELTRQIEERPHFKLCEPPHFLNVCFEHYPQVPTSAATPRKSSDAVMICRELQLQQLALVGYAEFKGDTVIRAAVINPELTSADLSALLDHIERVAERGSLSADH